MNIEDEFFDLIVAELSGEPSEEGKTRLNEWRKADRANEQAYQELVQLWKDSGNIAYLSPKAKSSDWQTIQKRAGTPQKKIQWMAAASIALAFLASWFIYNLTPKYETFVASSESIELKLNDGSTVFLNKNSELQINDDFGASERQVKLTGEAYFDVAKNEEIPFLIESGESKATVVGTEFNLLSNETGTELTVTEGKVEFGSESRTFLVAAGQSALLSSNSTQPAFSNHNTNSLSWKTGILAFNQVILSEVLEDLSKHYEVKFSSKDSETANLLFTSEFDHAELTEVIDELELVLNLNIQKENNIYIVNSSN